MFGSSCVFGLGRSFVQACLDCHMFSFRGRCFVVRELLTVTVAYSTTMACAVRAAFLL
jgi:hypothetical protein